MSVTIPESVTKIGNQAFSGVDIASGSWPPTDLQLVKEYRLRYGDLDPGEDDTLPF